MNHLICECGCPEEDHPYGQWDRSGREQCAAKHAQCLHGFRPTHESMDLRQSEALALRRLQGAGMKKLDAKFYGTIFKAKDNSPVGEDEYVVFLAKDTAFAHILPLYRAECVKLGADEQQIAAVDAMLVRLAEWRADHPDRLKVPDAANERLLV